MRQLTMTIRGANVSGADADEIIKFHLEDYNSLLNYLRPRIEFVCLALDRVRVAVCKNQTATTSFCEIPIKDNTFPS